MRERILDWIEALLNMFYMDNIYPMPLTRFPPIRRSIWV